MTSRRIVFALIVGIVCSVALAHGSKVDAMLRNDVEKSPSPNLDAPEKHSGGWFDSIDHYFKETVQKGKDKLEQLGQSGLKLVDRVVKIIPTPEAIFQLSKDVLVALPQEVIIHAMDAYC